MLRILFILALLLSLEGTSNEIYGRIAVDSRSVNYSEESKTDVESNQSKIGFKGSFKLNEDNGDLSLIYQAEYGLILLMVKQEEMRGPLNNVTHF